MKRIFTLLTIALTWQLASAQSGQHDQPSSLKEQLKQRREAIQNGEKPAPIIAFSAAEEECVLDSVYVYDENGNVIEKGYATRTNNVETITFRELIGGNWVLSYRQTVTYDGNGNVLSYQGEEYDGSNWVNDYMDTYTYNGLGQTLEEVYYYGWNGSDWDTGSKYISTYNSADSLAEYIFQQLQSGVWVNAGRDQYTYDGQNRLTQRTYDTWDGSSWSPSSRYTYTNDGQGNVTEELYEYYDSFNEVWEVSSRYTYTYDGQGNQTSELYQGWDGSSWVNQSQYNYTYNGQNQLIESESQDWDSQSNMWIPSSLSTYTYDNNGYAIEVIERYNWDGSEYTDQSKSEYLYNANGDWSGVHWYTWDGSNWVYVDGYEYFYDCSSVGIEEAANAFGLNLWPNPVANTLNLKVSNNQPTTITVYSVNGKVVLSQPYATQIAVDGLTSGMYVLELRNAESVQHQRFVKQ